MYHFEIKEGEKVALIGPNGTGENDHPENHNGAHTAHSRARSIIWAKTLLALPSHKRPMAGICLIPEGRRLFPQMTVLGKPQYFCPD